MTPEIKHRIEQIRRGEVPERYQKTKHGVLPNNWTVLRVGECLQRVGMPVIIQPNQLYTQIGIRSTEKDFSIKNPLQVQHWEINPSFGSSQIALLSISCLRGNKPLVRLPRQRWA